MKVILHKLFPYAPYLNEYIGFEDEQRPDESSLEAVERLRKLAEQSHKERYPHLYTEDGSPVIIKQVPSEPSEEEVLINKQFEEIKSKLIAAPIREEAEQILQGSGFKLNMELRKIVNDKK